MRYICPGIFITDTQANASIPSWNYHWNVIDPKLAEEGTEKSLAILTHAKPTDFSHTGYGVTHTVEVNAIWGPENTNSSAPDSYFPGGVNYLIVCVVQGYWTSFIRSYDPNKYRASGTPEWQPWTKQASFKRLMFQTNNTHMENVPSDQQERCAWLHSVGLSLRQ